jgi:hypothetical protein
MTTSTTALAPLSDRRRALAAFARDLQTIDRRLDEAGSAELSAAIVHIEDMERALERSGGQLIDAVGHGLGAAYNVARAGGSTAEATLRVGASGALAASSVVAEGAEHSADLLGRASQWLGRALIGAGNRARATAQLGGQQLGTWDVAGDRFARQWSDALRDASGRQLARAGESMLSSLSSLGGAVQNGFFGVASLARAAGNLAAAAGETLAAAKDLADASAIELAERAVELAGVGVRVVDRALDYSEQGVDAAGAALQTAGRALVDAGNAVNTARGTDTLLISASR